MIKRILVNLTEQQLKELDLMVKNSTYKNRSNAVRDAVNQFLEKKKLEELEKKLG